MNECVLLIPLTRSQSALIIFFLCCFLSCLFFQPPAEGESETQADADKQELTVEDEKNKHGFLILSREDSTMVGNCDLDYLCHFLLGV